MNLIIPMAGKGKRLRSHTLTVPKPLIPIAGNPVVQLHGGGEFQLTVAQENLKSRGTKFGIGTVNEWPDCENKIIEPVYIRQDTVVKNSKIAPGVSIDDNCLVTNSVLSESLVQNSAKPEDVNFANSMIGNFVNLNGLPKSVSLGDFSEW